MRKLLFLAFFLAAAVALFPQTFRETRVYVPQVTGKGREGDNAYFYKQLTYETVQYHALVRTQFSCDYVVSAFIEPHIDQFTDEEPDIDDSYDPVPEKAIPRIKNSSGRREFFSWGVDGDTRFYDSTGKGNYKKENLPPVPQEEVEKPLSPDDELEFVLVITLMDRLGGFIGRQNIIYSVADASVNRLISIVIDNMVAGIPEIEEDDWREMWFFLDANVVWAARFFKSAQQSINYENFGIKVSGEFHILKYMSLGLGFQFSNYNIKIFQIEEYNDMILEIPLFLKFVIKPLDNFTLDPYVGAAANISLHDKDRTEPFFLSCLAGLQAGFKAGEGIFVIGPQFSMDLFDSKTGFVSPKDSQRYMLQIGIGYKRGFLPKNRRIRD